MEAFRGGGKLHSSITLGMNLGVTRISFLFQRSIRGNRPLEETGTLSQVRTPAVRLNRPRDRSRAGLHEEEHQ